MNILENKGRRWSVYAAIGIALLILWHWPLAAQAASTAKPREFEVLSIQPSKPGTDRSIRWATTPDGYKTQGQSLWETIMLAYFPEGISSWRPEQLVGAPSWVNDLYDIDAKVSDADLDEWRKQGMALSQKPLLREMLQTMLADRCKLAFHRTPRQISGYELVMGKHGAKLTEFQSGEPLPQGVKLADGGVMVGYRKGEPPHVSFTAASMASLAQNLSGMGGGPVVDHTGLAGRYTFVLRKRDDPDQNVSGPEDWDVQEFGLELKATKLPISALVIDHIERPSKN